jgi:hypothetical protein
MQFEVIQGIGSKLEHSFLAELLMEASEDLPAKVFPTQEVAARNAQTFAHELIALSNLVNVKRLTHLLTQTLAHLLTYPLNPKITQFIYQPLLQPLKGRLLNKFMVYPSLVQ